MMAAPLRICIVSPNRNAWSETFIANHIAHLRGVELTLTDGHLPKRDIEGEPLLELCAADAAARGIAHGDLVVGEGWHQRAGEPHAEVHA